MSIWTGLIWLAVWIIGLLAMYAIFFYTDFDEE